MFSQTLVVNFESPGELVDNFKKVTGTMPTQSSGYISSATGTSAIWYTTNPGATNTTKPYGIPEDSVFAYAGGTFKVSMDFLASSSTAGKLTIPGLYIFNPLYTGANSGVIASFSSNNDSASSPDSISLKYVNDPVASSLGTLLVSNNPANSALNWGVGNTQWLRMELIFTPMSSTSATFGLNLYSIPGAESLSADLIGTTSTGSVNFGTSTNTIDFSAETKFGVGIRNYIDGGGGSLYIDHLKIESVPEPKVSVLIGLGLMLLLAQNPYTRRSIKILVK